MHGRNHKSVHILVIEPVGKRPLRKPRHLWNDNIRMDLREVGLENVDRMYLGQNRGYWWAVVNKVMNLGVP